MSASLNNTGQTGFTEQMIGSGVAALIKLMGYDAPTETDEDEARLVVTTVLNAAFAGSAGGDQRG